MAYPELDTIGLQENVIKEEEQSFLRTLDQGLLLLDGIVGNAKTKEISGKKVFDQEGELVTEPTVVDQTYQMIARIFQHLQFLGADVDTKRAGCVGLN